MNDFTSFISALGFEPPETIDPGRITRFSTNGRRGDDAGWALLFPDGDGGVVGDWRSGEQHVWQDDKVETYTPEQKLAWQERVERARSAAEAQRRAEYAEAAARAAQIWEASVPATTHAYLTRKGVRAHGARLYNGDLSIGGMSCDGALLLQARAATGELRSVQFIQPDDKRYLPRGEIHGSYYSMGRFDGKRIALVEGFATGASVNEATGLCVAVAFDAGNLMPVAKALRAKYPQIEIIVCADNDVGVKAGKVENPGVTKAREVGEAMNGPVRIPELPDGSKCDWNDVALKLGRDAVRIAIDPSPAGITPISATDDAFMRHMVEQEGQRRLASFSAFGDKIRDRLFGRTEYVGAKLPWPKTHTQVALRPKEVSIWAGINGHGKSALLNQVAMDLMLQGEKVFIASLEMPVEATAARMVRQANGMLVPSPGYIDAFERWSEGRLFLYDHVGRETPRKMVALLKYVYEKTGARHLMIDSMMRVVRSPDDYSGQKDFVEMLCACAHDTGVHIHLVAHSRKGETEFEQIDKFDIKGASEIGDQADNLFTVFRNKRKELALAQPEPDNKFRNQADTTLTVAKQRHGDWEGPITLWYSGDSKAYHETEMRNDWHISYKQMGIEDHVPF